MCDNFSAKIYENYYQLKDRRVQIMLKHGTCLIGFFHGFYYANSEQTEIFQWKFILEKETDSTIHQEDELYLLDEEISQVYFFENNRTIYNNIK